MYILDNAAPQAPTRLQALADLFDAETTAHLEGTGIAAGWHCLEIGGGGGSIANWLAARVGSAGHVLATDIDPRHLEFSRQPNVEVRQHDIGRDPLPSRAFDLIHARLVLNFVPLGQDVFSRLRDALKPGGWLVVENFEVYANAFQSTDASDAGALPSSPMLRQVMQRSGADPQFGRKLGIYFRSAGLIDVELGGRTFAWRGGSTAADMMRANCEQLRDALLAAGLSADDLARDYAKLAQPEFEFTSPILWTARGRRAA